MSIRRIRRAVREGRYEFTVYALEESGLLRIMTVYVLVE
jgi:hypothetical protein